MTLYTEVSYLSLVVFTVSFHYFGTSVVFTSVVLTSVVLKSVVLKSAVLTPKHVVSLWASVPRLIVVFCHYLIGEGRAPQFGPVISGHF